jgi:hypothetical protein
MNDPLERGVSRIRADIAWIGRTRDSQRIRAFTPVFRRLSRRAGYAQEDRALRVSRAPSSIGRAVDF